MTGLPSVDVAQLPVADIIPKTPQVQTLRLALATLMDFHPHVILTGSERFAPIAHVLSEAYSVNRHEAQDEVLEAYQTFARTKSDFNVLRHLFTLPEMKTEPLQTTQWQDRKSVLYNGRYLPVPAQTEKAEVMITGQALLLKDNQNKAIGIASVQQTPYQTSMPLEQIDTCINDRKFNQQCEEILNSSFNMASLPLQGRINLRFLLEKEPDRARQLLNRFGPDIVSYFEQFKTEKDLAQGVDFIEYLDTEAVPEDKAHFRPNTARRLVESIALAQFSAPVLDRSENTVPASRLLHDRLSGQVQELINLHDKQPPLTIKDWNRAALAFDYLLDIPIFINLLNRHQSHHVHLPDYPVDFMQKFFDEFAAVYPEAKNITQTYYDLLFTSQIDIQQYIAKHASYAADKKAFYEKITEGQFMNTQVNTIDATDVSRTTSIVVDNVNQTRQNETEPRPLSCLMLGINDGVRFEDPLCRQLEEHNIHLDRIVAVDMNDYRQNYPPRFKQYMQETNAAGQKRMEFVHADFTKPEFGLKEKFDLILLPWSIVSDIIMKEDVQIVMEKLAHVLNPGGRIMVDIPAPIKDVGYIPLMRQQGWYQQILGIVNRSYPHGQELLDTLLNIMPLPEVIVRAMMAGLLPTNYPYQPDKQHQLLTEVDPGTLKSKHDHGLDLTAIGSPDAAFWATPAGPRATFSLEYVGRDKIRQLGFPFSFLLNLNSLRELAKN